MTKTPEQSTESTKSLDLLISRVAAGAELPSDMGLEQLKQQEIITNVHRQRLVKVTFKQ